MTIPVATNLERGFYLGKCVLHEFVANAERRTAKPLVIADTKKDLCSGPHAPKFNSVVLPKSSVPVCRKFASMFWLPAGVDIDGARLLWAKVVIQGVISRTSLAAARPKLTEQIRQAVAVMAHEGYPADHLFLIIKGRTRGFCSN